MKIVSSKNSKVTVKGLTKGTKYYAKVRAYKTISGKKYYGNYSKIKSAKTKGKKPLSAAQLKKYRKKCFYTTPFDEDKEFVMIEFDKISGKTVKFKLKHENAWYLNDNVTGKLVGNQIKFTIKNWYSTVYVNDTVGFKNVKTPTKTKGTITLVDNKTIKLQITSRKDSNNFLKTGEYRNCKMLYPKKAITMKNIAVEGHGF